MDSHYVNKKRKQTAILETVVNQCPVLCSQHNRMKLVLERPWIALSNYTVVQKMIGLVVILVKQGIHRGGETICSSPPTAVRRWQKSLRIYVRPRTGPQSAHLWWPAVAKLQAASVLITYIGSCAMGQTDGSRYSTMLPRAAGIIMPRSGCFEA